jgi:glyoxylase-like metal-dependent hydrolase (beta-lactamase superfamily II)
MIERLRVGALGVNCYLLPAGEPGGDGLSPCIVVDPGAEAERIVDAIESRRLRPILIACTHGHLDHCSGIGPLRELLGKRGFEPRLAIHRLDLPYVGARSELTNQRHFEAIGASDFFAQLWTPIPEADISFEEGEYLAGSAWKIIHTPGHSAGSVCFFDETLGLLISGDTLFRDGVGRTDGPDSDPAALGDSIEKKLFTLPGSTRVFPGHGEPTTIGREGGGR